MNRLTHRYRRNGFILVVVLGMVMLLSALLFAFHRTTRRSLEMAEGFRRSERAMHSALAGLSVAIAAVAEANDVTSAHRFADLRTGKEVFSVNNGTCTLTITEENGRINVNTLKDQNGQLHRKRIDQLLRLIDLLNRRKDIGERIGYSVVAAIIDWIDPDDDVTLLPFVNAAGQGVESSYYETLRPPYRCKNGPMDTIEELQGVRGITPEVFATLRELLTTTGSGRININAAPPLVIESLCEQMDSTLARMIVQRRDFKPFETTAELRQVPGMTDNVYLAIQDMIEVQPSDSYYRVQTTGQSEDRTFGIEALLHRNTQTGNVDIILYRES
ncbi:MAG TPA: type II secretion system minor pseudopilin GspK [Sedimentisphaerales bacterium]|nr:type II secretion system minor pseudopilin GspK [Sedimentisphaerales bacterium]HRS10151.1 type II secretion system minor pseudopilin GspK [Sedimentisphaerales bacterium]HRV46857.1 type II secretion system minor pseudopilin GspK [Sedimentisphaerales bacterium]